MSEPGWQPTHPDPNWVSAQLIPHYPLPENATCHYHASGLHHTYFIGHPEQTIVCRAYRRDWRSHVDALYELTILDQLYLLDCPVSAPLCTRKQQLAIEVDSPTGLMTLALFRFAAGHAPGAAITLAQALQLGIATAQLHLAMRRVTTAPQRTPLDLSHLIDHSLHSLALHLPQSDYHELTRQMTLLRQRLPALPARAPYFSLIHGDINLKNVHFDGEQLTFIDFDQCGPGWYAFEIAKFFHASRALPHARLIQQAFLRGYQSLRPLALIELDAIPAFIPLAHLWVMAIHAANADYLTTRLLTPEYWQRKLRTLRELLRELPA